MLQRVACCFSEFRDNFYPCSVSQGLVVHCRVLQCAVVCCSVLQCVAMCCRVLQGVVVYCSELLENVYLGSVVQGRVVCR